MNMYIYKYYINQPNFSNCDQWYVHYLIRNNQSEYEDLKINTNSDCLCTYIPIPHIHLIIHYIHTRCNLLKKFTYNFQ